MNIDIKNAIELFQNGQIEKAQEICSEIKKKDPKNLINLNLIGIILFQKKEFKEAIEILENSLKLNPNQTETYNNLGIAYSQIKNFDKAIIAFKNAIKINPQFIDSYINLGVSFKEIKKENEAIESWNKVIKIDKNNTKAYNNIGSILLESEKFDKSIDFFNKAIILDKNFYQAYYNRGKAYQKINLFKKAIDDYSESIKLNSHYVEAYIARGFAYKSLNMFKEAFKDWTNAHEINKKYQSFIGRIFYFKKKLCDWKNYENDYLFFKKNISNISKLIHPFNSLSTFNSAELQKNIATNYVYDNFKNYNKKISNYSFVKKKIFDKIKVGYYSSDFKNHAMSFLLAEMFETHNKDKFEIIGFSLTKQINDKMSKRIIQTFDEFHDVSTKTEKEISEISKKLGMDIAVDLMGFTKNNRFGIFIEKCAPLQINFLGYPGTLGTDLIDYIVADKTLISKEEEKNYSEKVIYLPDTYQCNDSKKEISKKSFLRKDFNLPDDKFVFCCFNQKYKFDPKTIKSWINILTKIENSVLWLLDDENESTNNLMEEFKLGGLDVSRIIFSKKLPLDEHLARHSLADLFLDTFPYGAHTTASDSLRTGLPLITKIGNTFASRVAASLLKAIGLEELITTNDEQYINLAIELAKNPNKLKIIKNKLNKNIQTKPLFDTKRYTKNLEMAYNLAYKRYLENLPTENIEI